MPTEFIKKNFWGTPLAQLVKIIVSGIDRLTDWIGTLLSWMCFAMMLMICSVVVMRYLFQSGNIIFLQESVVYLHSTIFLLAAGWALKRNGHVRVDVFYRQFSPVKKAWVDSLGILVFLLPFCGFLFFASLDFVELSWSRNEESGDAGGIPLVYLLKTLIPGMSLLLAIQGIAELIRNGLFLCGLADQPDDISSNRGLEL